jgi:ribosome biogenesis GTPase
MEMSLEDLGYDDFFASSREESGLDGYAVARVIAEYKGAYRIKDPANEFLAEITGKQIFAAREREDYPAVGDWVAMSKIDTERAIIHGVLRRRTILRRKYSGRFASQVIAANIDVAFIVASANGDFNLNRYERYLAIVRDGGIAPVIVLNKVDLVCEEELEEKKARIETRFKDIDFVLSSATTGKGLDGLYERISRGNTYCFLGSSGVGKSSLINRLLGEEVIRTDEISSQTGKGKHTTTGREMYFMADGGIVIDNPGMREIGMTDSQAGIEDVFAEIGTLASECRFKDCTHSHEPGCAVREAVDSGELDEAAFSNYARLKKEAEFYELSALEKREKDRQFGKFVKKAKKELKKFEP